jgi:hypothetical protein
MTTTFGCGQWGWFATSSPTNIHEGIHWQILGQAMVFNCFTWFLVWSWSNKHIWHNLSHPSTHLTSPLVAMLGGTMCWCKKGWCILTKHGICQNHHLAHMHFHTVQCPYLCYILLNYGANKKQFMLHFISMHCALNKILTMYS